MYKQGNVLENAIKIVRIWNTRLLKISDECTVDKIIISKAINIRVLLNCCLKIGSEVELMG